jgi:hypothetical protein
LVFPSGRGSFDDDGPVSPKGVNAERQRRLAVARIFMPAQGSKLRHWPLGDLLDITDAGADTDAAPITILRELPHTTRGSPPDILWPGTA